jgi:hypothetical protein
MKRDDSGMSSIVSGDERNPFTGSSTSEVTDRLKTYNTYSLSSSQIEMAALIERTLRSEGFESPSIAAAIVNAYYESGLNPRAKGDLDKSTGLYHAFGLFQLYTPGGAGHGMTESQMLDPVTNTKRIAQVAKATAYWSISKETDDIPKLAADWSQYVEAPRDRIGNMTGRASAAAKMFALDRP